ncbi:hypothetical protein K402DRAFT_399701 [Aulographum hederae CBS 113979]|uniref:Uncharacterized protein n=1 Tax=Aulographum hederae CBS 113979 TaxID=1176131 RepID=A0A6G1HHQ5_9PEZI|nr:hypothetical protein K402DRAFT_399701 [Aulographum hederae CBS 113979]
MTRAKPLPRTLYRGSDPEWQEFKKFYADSKRIKAAQLKLVAIIRGHVGRAKSSAAALGKIDSSKGRFWLELSVPDGPPQEYEISGIAITDTYIAWADKTMSQVNYQKQQDLLWPSATFWSFYATSKFIFKQSMQRLKQGLGIEPSTQDRHQQILNHSKNTRDIVDALRNKQSPFRPGSGDSSTGETPGQPTSTITPPSNIPKGAPGQRGSFPQITEMQAPGSRNPQAYAIFFSSLVKNQKKFSRDPPRGTIVVSGLIEILGSKARITLDVTAAYDPKRNEYVVISAAPRQFTRKVQVPKGGK